MPAAEAKSSVAELEGRRLVLTRTFDAPRDLVFKAWTDPAHLARWWGPHGFSNPVCEADARPGGAIRIDMKGPDGNVYPMTGTFEEVVPPERLVFLSGAMQDARGNPAFEIRNTVTFAEKGGKTALTLEAVVVKASPEAAPALAGMEIGWGQSLERLEADLGGELLLTRVYDAPRDLVFRAWTEPERLARWFGPPGMTMTVRAHDLRPGGVFHYSSTFPDGREVWSRWVFREVTPPERLVVVFSFSDEHGNVVRHPFDPNHPLERLSTVTFQEHLGRTMLTYRTAPLNATEAEREAFRSTSGGMRQGWAGALEKLAEELARG